MVKKKPRNKTKQQQKTQPAPATAKMQFSVKTADLSGDIA